MALGLDYASERISSNDSSGCGHLPGKLVPLEKFDYHNQLMGCVLRKSFHQVNFTGITASYHAQLNGVSCYGLQHTTCMHVRETEVC